MAASAPATRAALLVFCRSLPHATEDIKWGNDLVFSIGGKMFAAFTANGTNATFGCKVPEDDFDAITSVAGIRPAPYAARFHWISVDDPKVLPAPEAKKLIRQSYELVLAKLPARTQRLLSGDAPATSGPARATPARKARQVRPASAKARKAKPARPPAKGARPAAGGAKGEGVAPLKKVRTSASSRRSRA